MNFTTSTHTTNNISDYVHAVLWGPARTQSIGGARHIMTLVDDYSRRVWLFLIKSKVESITIFKRWKALVENQIWRKLKTLRTYNGLEFFFRLVQQIM